MSDYVWVPTADYVENANVTRLIRAQGLDTIDQLREWSVADIGNYWATAAADLGIIFDADFDPVLDLSRGIEHPDWFIGGRLNIVNTCLERWARDSEFAKAPAVIHESEDSTVSTMSFGELAVASERAAAGLQALGVKAGDAVATFLPMVPEAVVAVYAVARLGAVLVPLFSGFAAGAIASRLQDSDASVVITADATLRRGKSLQLLPQLAEALASSPSVQHAIVVENLDVGWASTLPVETHTWKALLDLAPDTPVEIASLPADATLLLAYTSGTTGKPKGAVHTHAGFITKTASEIAYSFDVHRGGVFCWITDMGWIMGPLAITGTHANGAALLLYEGSPDSPDINRLWNLVQRHGITMFGVSPTLVRALRSGENARPEDYDLNSVHTIGSTGEPWDEDSYEWLARDVFKGRVPIINFSGGTEVGGSFLAPYPVEEIRACSLGGPSLGMDVDVVDEHGASLRGEVGELVCRQPWPAMTRGVWKDEERYLESYWSTFPGIWRHGDYALIDSDGQWFVRSRSDDVMNVAGKRLAPAEVEAVLTSHPSVAESAVVGVPDAVKGEAIWAFWVPRAGAVEDVSTELSRLVASELGKPFTPTAVIRVSRLPKTISGKIVRRAVRAAVMGTDAGDLSGMDGSEAIDEIRNSIPS